MAPSTQSPHLANHSAHGSGPMEAASAHGLRPGAHAGASYAGIPAGPSFTAPCPCGCEEHAGSAASRSRVGVALLRGATPSVGFVPPPPAAFVLARAPIEPILADDPVPISS